MVGIPFYNRVFPVEKYNEDSEMFRGLIISYLTLALSSSAGFSQTTNQDGMLCVDPAYDYLEVNVASFDLEFVGKHMSTDRYELFKSSTVDAAKAIGLADGNREYILKTSVGFDMYIVNGKEVSTIFAVLCEYGKANVNTCRNRNCDFIEDDLNASMMNVILRDILTGRSDIDQCDAS